MINFIEYVVTELKSRKLSKANALSLIKQYSLPSRTGGSSSALHPLLHRNTSDLGRQSYSSTFYGDEFFLKDHQVEGQKVLPGVAYLEMARAAVEKAMPYQEEATAMELRNVVWAYPIVVSEAKEVTIVLFADDKDIRKGHIDFEIYSADDAEGAEEMVHCQGQVVLADKSASAKLDLDTLREETREGQLEPDSIYAAYAKLGLNYGPAHRGIRTIRQGDGQLLAQLELPAVVEQGRDKYVLHPAMMDSAVQAAIGFLDDLSQVPDRPSLPFALESLKVFSTCNKKMFARIRYSQGHGSGDKITKLDIDLCDRNGNVCVQMQGFTSREFRASTTTAGTQERKNGVLLAAPVWQVAPEISPGTGDTEYTQQYIMLHNMPNVDLEQLETLIPRSRCLSLQATPGKNIAERYNEVAKACFKSIRNILRDKPEGEILVRIIIGHDREGSLLAGLSGLIHTATQENPLLKGQVVLVESHIRDGELAEKLRYGRAGSRDTVIKYEQGIRNVLRWLSLPDKQGPPAVAFREHGVYVITGGLGKLGQLFAREILQQTARSRIILTGRSNPEELKEKASVIRELRTIRDDVEYRQLDIDDLAQVKQFVADIVQEYGQINGILHSAGMIADNYILKKTKSEFSQILRPKVTGTFHLDRASRDIELDFFVLFSSVASSFGNAGQADYAAANGFMNQFAGYRKNLVSVKKRHGKTLAIHWPLWMDGGMAPDRTTQEYLQQTTGMYPMRTATGMQAFYRGINSPYDQILVMEGDLQQLQVLLQEPAIKSPIREPRANENDTEVNAGNLAKRTGEYLRKEFSVVLKLPAHRIDTQQPLEKYGIDSILALSLTNQLEKTFGSLPKTLFFEYQTIGELAGYFIKSYSGTLTSLFDKEYNSHSQSEPVDTISKSTSQTQTRRNSVRRLGRQGRDEAAATNELHTEPIAIVGMSGRYPEALDIQSYWDNLCAGKDCITEIPKERWDWHEHYTEDRDKNGYHYSKWGGFISGVDEFDPRFFNISPREAEFIDPQERLFLQHAWMAVEDAGYDQAGLGIPHKNDLAGQVGVYAGVMYSEYQLFGIEASMRGKRMSIPGSYASIANRVSYVLNLHGPSITLDTMCSSSLSAIHLACQDLKLGRTHLAIAGGVNVSIHPNKYLFLSSRQFISTAGHCQSFGEGGDGYIPGEGVGVVLLKRLSEAERDGDHIYGVIKGSALNHGGKTNGYSVPNPQAQAALIGRVLEESKTDPRHISYIEAHGTGTKLGDPIEIAALSNAFQRYTQDTGYCLIGSAKSNIGHCESAAGIAGLTKVLLQMKHRQIVPSLHSAVLNPYIDFQKTPFVVNQTLKTWDPPVIGGRQQPRIAGISAFGAGGSNAHLIIEEYIPQEEADKSTVFIGPGEEIIIPLSARNTGQLTQKAIDLLDFINTSEPDLLNIAYTLQTGREAMEERVGFIIKSMDDFVRKLQDYINGGQDMENVFQGNTKQNKGLLSLMNADDDFEHTLDKWISGKKLTKVLELWVNGLELDWNRFYGNVKPRRISLPAYPFARERYWIDRTADKITEVTGITGTVLHPLLHTNTSGFKQLSYRSTFNGEEFFVKDHQVSMGNGSGHKMFPAAALLEMARVAVEQASQGQEEPKVPELRNIAWGQPALIEESREINIALFANEDGLVDYEIYSRENEEEIVHSLGQAVYSDRPVQAGIDIEHLKGQMRPTGLAQDTLYPAFSAMGLNYGPAYRGIVAIDRGEHQLLAQLHLPVSVEATQNDYILHPSLLNSAFQASACLLADPDERPDRALLPFALTALTVVSACAKEMYAWVRYAPDNNHEDGKTPPLDIDLCDLQGNICARLRGLTLQEIALGTFQVITNRDTTLPTYTNQAEVIGGSRDLPVITEKPQNIQLTDMQQVNVSFVQTHISKPQAVRLNILRGGTVIEDRIVKQQVIQADHTREMVNGTNGNPDGRDREETHVPIQPFASSKGSEPRHTREQLHEYLRTSLAEALYLNTAEVDIDRPFVDLGLDSIVGVEWMKAINKKLGLDISATRVYDYSTIKTLGAFLYEELASDVASGEVHSNSLSPTFSE